MTIAEALVWIAGIVCIAFPVLLIALPIIAMVFVMELVIILERPENPR